MWRVETNFKQFEKYMRAFPNQFRFAAATAMNRSGEDANKAIRDEVDRQFTIRDKQMPRYVAPVRLRPEQRAKKTNLTVVLETEGSGRILNPFEAGQPKVATNANEPVAIPTKQLRHSESTVIPQKWYPTHLGFVRRFDPAGAAYYALGRGAIKKGLTPFKPTKSGKVQVKGKDRTFVLDPRLHDGVTMRQWGVYQRIGPSKGDIRMLWRYTMRVPRPPILHFRNTAVTTFHARLAVNFKGALTQAIKAAKPGRL